MGEWVAALMLARGGPGGAAAGARGAELGVLGLQAPSHSPVAAEANPRGPSPRALQLGKALCSVLASDPEALGSSGLLTLGQSFLARPLPPSGAPLSALGWWLLPSQEAGGEEEGNQPPVRVGGQEGLTVSPRQCPQ